MPCNDFESELGLWLEAAIMKFTQAVIAGVLGALAMSGIMFLLRLAGLNVSLEFLLGSMIGPVSPVSVFVIGFVIHLCVGAVAGLVYAGMFEFAIQRAGFLAGAGIGLCHGLLAGLVMSAIPAMNPLTQAASAPGAFLQNVEFGPVLFILLHIVFGAVTGAAYGRTLQRPHLYTNRTA